MEYFRQMGFDIVNVVDDSFTVSAVPCVLAEINLKSFFDDILFDNQFKRESIPLILKEIATLKEISEETALSKIINNVKRVFGV
jgi:Tat protein secretion system quality control protein TatD with DNase activity